MNIKQLADEAKWYFSQIAALTPDQIARLDEEAHEISELFEVVLKKNGFRVKMTIRVHAYWSQCADVLFWPNPSKSIYPAGILFRGYCGFLLWIKWRLLAMSCSDQEADRACNEIEGWREKVLGPRRVDRMHLPAPPLRSDIELR